MASDERKKINFLQWLEPNYKKANRSNKHEKRIAEALGGKRQRRSGGMPLSKYDRDGAYGKVRTTEGRDIETPDFYLEHKRTEKLSMSVKLEWLEKICEAARRGGKDPGLVITFDLPKHKGANRHAEQDWLMMPLSVAQSLLKKLHEEE